MGGEAERDRCGRRIPVPFADAACAAASGAGQEAILLHSQTHINKTLSVHKRGNQLLPLQTFPVCHRSIYRFSSTRYYSFCFTVRSPFLPEFYFIYLFYLFLNSFFHFIVFYFLIHYFNSLIILFTCPPLFMPSYIFIYIIF